MNAFGGEDRFWMGPEGGQFSIYFAKGQKFVFDDWQVPAILHTEPFKVISKADNKAVFGAEFSLTNKGLIHKSRSQTNLQNSYTMEMPTPEGVQKASAKEVSSNINVIELL